MKILLISEFFPLTIHGDFTGGVEARTFFVARELAKRHQVTVLCSYTGGKRHEKMAGFSVIRVGPRRRYTTNFDITRIFYAIAAIWIGRKINVDIVEGTNFINQIIAYAIGKLQKIPIVAWTPDVWKGQWIVNMGYISAITGTIIERYNLSHRDIRFIAISNSVAQKMTAVGVPQKLITIIPCGVDYQLINSIKTTKSKQPVITVVSRLVKYKSLDVLIRACALLTARSPRLTLRIIGQGPEEQNLRQLARRLKIEQNVYFVGFVSKHKSVVKKLKASHIFCLPSETEGFGIAIIEALGCGVPTVVADLPVNREITGGNGVLLFKPGNHHDLAKKLQMLLDDKKRYATLQKETKRQAKKYDWEKIAKQTEKLYESMRAH